MHRRARAKNRITNPKEIADHLRRLGCTEEQIARHLLPLLSKNANHNQRQKLEPILPSATERLLHSILLSPGLD
jgi:hypothetical protein